MTDGIIQDWGKKYRIPEHFVNELIKKIKEAWTNRPYYQLDNGVKVYNDILETLIGDNK